MITKFDLHHLGWHDFQNLCHTILREVLGQTVIRFLDSNDAGRDGAFYGHWTWQRNESYGGQFVVQVKHTAVQRTLSLSMLGDELDKAERLASRSQCDVYILITNARVTGETALRFTEALRDRKIEQCMVLGEDWINQTISENSKLRMLVPRLYGLGDLTQILDERAYEQAKAVIESMRPDLAKLVRTQTYERAAAALNQHGFVLLAGAPMTGKTTIAAELSIAAADAFGTQIVRLDDATRLSRQWNPNEKQLFWLDDVFGATQVEHHLASAWQRATSLVTAAIRQGCKFVLTSRSYVLRAAYPSLKPGSFPLQDAATVVVDVEDLTISEREQILYNHLKHGTQDRKFLQAVTPHLDDLARDSSFTPELARRFADPAFTGVLQGLTKHHLKHFFSKPRQMLESVVAGLDTESRAALGLIFLQHGWLPSPLTPNAQDSELLERLGGTLGGVSKALEHLSGSLVAQVVKDGVRGWEFAHPTMADAYAHLLESPELLHLLIDAFDISVLLSRTTCGDVGIENALVIPQDLWHVVMTRLHEPISSGDQWLRERGWASYVRRNGVPEFQESYFERYPDELQALSSPELSLEWSARNGLVASMHQNGVLPKEIRSTFAAHLIDYCIEGTDCAVLWDKGLRSLLSDSEAGVLRDRLQNEVFTNPANICYSLLDNYDDDEHPEDYSQPLEDLANAIEAEFPDSATAEDVAKDLRSRRWQWVVEREDDWQEKQQDNDKHELGTRNEEASVARTRSIFDDLIVFD